MKILTYPEYREDYAGAYFPDNLLHCRLCEESRYLKDMIIIMVTNYGLLKFCSETCLNIFILQYNNVEAK